METKKKSSLMQQYNRVKNQYSDTIVLCRVGDFYEAFGEDAETISRVLEIALTARDKNTSGTPIPMAGVPHHSLDSYLYKLVKEGHKVAIVEQMEDAKQAKGLVKRDVVRIVTPGTVTDSSALDQKSNNYLISAHQIEATYGLASVDVSTGEFAVTELEDLSDLWSEVNRIGPAECLFSEDFESQEILDQINIELKATINYLPDWRFDHQSARSELLDHFSILSLDGFGCENMSAATCAAGALIYYLHETQKQEVLHIQSLRTYTNHNFMVLDADTLRNLELIRSMRDGSSTGTLLEMLDQTMTSMGARCLKQWLLQPHLKTDLINQRLEAVDELKSRIALQEELREALRQMYDIQRLISRISLGTANAREVLALKDSLRLIPSVKLQLEDCSAPFLTDLNQQLDPMTDLADLIENAIHQEPPVTIQEGNIIRDGYSEELDSLREITLSGKDWITELQQGERERTGISSLKIGYNQVFGYYIDVTKPNLDLVPDHYIRKQTLTNSERFITPDLKERESQILNAEERIHQLEYDLFCDIRNQISSRTNCIQKIAAAISMIDVIANFAYIASKYDYSKPIIDDSSDLIIDNGRHAVVEQLFTGEGFVPNNTELNCTNQQLHIITGPNMSGKSTYLRQTALIVLMAQIGCFVPASTAKIGVVDRIFTRVGASDNLVMGQSTFLVEMNETANILNNATSKSLIILDEIGRGTSTFDGLSIAWAVAEYILDDKEIGAKTLFATHYHELIELASKYKNVKNYNVAVHEDGEKITFLRKVVEGGTDQSYGIHVARLAGLPQVVVDRANQILAVLEQHNLSIESNQSEEASEPPPDLETRDIPHKRKRISRKTFQDNSLQMALFTPKTHPIVEELQNLDLNQLTPMEALNLIYKLHARAVS